MAHEQMSESVQDKIAELRRCIAQQDRLQFELLERVLVEFEQAQQDVKRWNWVKNNLRASDMEWSLTVPAYTAKYMHFTPASAIDALIAAGEATF